MSHLKYLLLVITYSIGFQCMGQLDVDCLPSHELTDTLYRTNNDSIEVSDYIQSNGIYDNDTESYYSAGDSIVLVAGFEVVVGSTFDAEIATCTGEPCTINGMHAALAEFDDSYTISYSGTDVLLTTTGLPNHTSPYWSNTTERCTTDPMGNELCTNTNTTEDHELFVQPYVSSFDDMAPGNIDDFNGSYSLTVPQSPTVASNSTSTGLGAIGFAVSGAVIYNDEEGPNIPLDDAVGSLDFNGAHTGPQSYHYHLEPQSWTFNDSQLVGIMADGFYLYGRKCQSTGDYPTDLDSTNGHTAQTQHSCSAEYHYHIENVTYLNQYYILFPYDYAGTPSTIN